MFDANKLQKAPETEETAKGRKSNGLSPNEKEKLTSIGHHKDILQENLSEHRPAKRDETPNVTYSEVAVRVSDDCEMQKTTERLMFKVLILTELM